ncbi:fibronectin type III domain-containing protein [Chryseobacterium sp. StRB126]|uniref:RCC1 domain-containing protein n=1 Tax=Chryseobacterium sp. StRB126 TaxID=878220 RepID=UPI000696A89E|nr:fibronectin type III domain-containing protein [Chryseobacterium sp. StRB126]
MRKKITLSLLLMLFLIASKISAQCTTGIQYPAGIHQATGAAGSNTINSDARTGQYTNVHIEPSKYYTFSTSVSTDYITITNDTGTQVIASGVTPVSFVSAYNQAVRYYIHQNAQCQTTNQFVRTRKVTWVTAQACLDVTPTGVSNISPVSCTINYTTPATAPAFGYQAYVSTSSATPGATVPVFTSTTNSLFVNDLNPDTTYHYWLRSDCDYQKSAWIYGGTFTTISSLLCNSAYNGIYPSATITPNCTGSDDFFATNVKSGSFSNIAVVPNTQYQFKTNYGTDFITITNALGTVVLASGTNPVNWNSGSTSGVVRFYSHDNAQCGYGMTTTNPRNKYVNCITTSVTCIPPSNLAVANITSNSIRMSWAAPTNVPSSGYEIYMVTTNTAPTVNSTATHTNTTTTKDINGLTAGVTYYYWIRSNCGTEKSSWASGGSFTANQSLSCNGAIYGLYPDAAFTPSCTGSAETITSSAFAGQYSNVNITANQQYVFSSSVGTDFITITNSAGTSVLASGPTPLSWSSGTNTGGIRYYLHSNSNCGSQNTNRTKYIQCATTVNCGVPSQLSVSNITSNSCRLSWTAPATAPTNYDIYIITSNTAPTSTTTPSATTTSAGAGVLNGISAATTYYYWIRSNCNGTKSAWVYGGSFTTLAALTCNGATHGLYPNATFTPTCTGSPQQIVADAYAGEYSNVNVVSNTQYTFFSSNSSDYITVTNALGNMVLASGTTPLNWVSGTYSGVVRYHINTNASCGTQNTNRIRYIQCMGLVTCGVPSNLSVSNITSNSCSLNWYPPAAAPTNYEVYLSAVNTAPVSGTAATHSTTGPAIALSNSLSPSTTYFYWVRSSCNGTKSNWVSGGNFTTLPTGCWKMVSTGMSHSLGIKSDGTLWAWGANDFGQLGDGTSTAKTTPVQIGTANDWQSVSAGTFHSMAIKNNGTLWGWGINGNSRLGDGTTNGRIFPGQITSDTNWQSVCAGDVNTLAIKTNGTLWAWGYNGNAQFGDGTTNNRSTPYQVGTATNWRSVDLGSVHTLATKTDGTLWAWGTSSDGQVGDGTTATRFTALQIGTETDWQEVAAGGFHSVGLKTNGVLYTWGKNLYGQLGNGTNTSKSVPTPVYDGVQSISAGSNHTVGTTSYGNMWFCGINTFGQLGDGTTTSKNTITVTNSNNHQKAITGFDHTFLLNYDSSISSCGLNGTGQLGNGSTANSSSFVSLTCPVSNLAVEEVISSANNLKVFPSPVNDILNVSSDQKIISVTILNTAGQLILTKVINNKIATVDVSGLISGVYMVKINLDNRNVKTVKVIKR